MTAGFLACALAAYAAVVALHAGGRVPAYVLLGDLRSMAGAAELPIYAGWMSEAGVLLWWSAASVTAVAALASARRAPATARYLAASAALTGLLTLDDALLIHDRAVPALVERVVPALAFLAQPGVYALYALLTLAWLWRWRRPVLAGEPALLGAALALFAVSVGLDVLPGGMRPWGGLHPVFEDGAKWLGIACWTAWSWRSSLAALGQGERCAAARASIQSG